MSEAEHRSIVDRLRCAWLNLTRLESCIYSLAEAHRLAATFKPTPEIQAVLKDLRTFLGHASGVSDGDCNEDSVAYQLTQLESLAGNDFLIEIATHAEYFTAAYVHSCCAAVRIAPANYKGQEGSSHYQAHALWCLGKSINHRLLIGRVGETQVKPGTLGERLQENRPKLIEQWCNEVGERPKTGLAVLEMELVQAIILSKDIPLPSETSTAALSPPLLEMTKRLTIKCKECGGAMIVQKTKRKTQYRKCVACGATGKTTKRS